MTNKIVIYPDGLSIGNPGPSGWAATLQLQNESKVLAEKIVFGHHPMKTNLEMELIATIQGLSALKQEGQDIEIVTDNEVIVNALNGNHNYSKNQELIRCLQRLAAKHTVSTMRMKAQINEIAREQAEELSEMLEMSGKNVYVFGSPTFTNYKLLERKLDEIIGDWTNNNIPWEVSIIVDCEMGASFLGEKWAFASECYVIRIPALFRVYRENAREKRNDEILKVATHAVAFWDGQCKNTLNMIQKVKKQGLPLRVVKV